MNLGWTFVLNRQSFGQSPNDKTHSHVINGEEFVLSV